MALGAGAFLPKTLEELALFNLAHKDEELQVRAIKLAAFNEALSLFVYKTLRYT